MIHAESAGKTSRPPQKITSGKFRPEIEGLRTVAFFLVAVFHIWLNRVSGGVDVFFTVAGLLVTLTLLSHIRKYGRIRIGMYFGRLATRLLPTAAVVLIAIIGLTIILLPSAMWRDLFTQIFASATYWENWYLALNAVDYLAIDTTRSPLQHFWALSIQGQFYIIWLLVFVVGAWLASRIPARAKQVLFCMVATLIVSSLAWSIYQTASDQQFAYFSTLTRVWEFGFGSMMALIIERIKLNATFAAVLSWIALGSIIAIGALLPVFDLFPGWIALVPVLAACIIVAAGQEEAPWGASALLASKPMVWLGGLGYGVYLWHWPMLVFALEVQGRHRAGPLTGTAVILGSVILAWITKVIIEDPFLRARGASRRRTQRSAIAIASVVTLVVAGTSIGAVTVIDKRAAAQQRMAFDPCIGANALGGYQECEDVDFGDVYIPSVPSADIGGLYETQNAKGEPCSTKPAADDLYMCTWGASDSDTRIALIGNSHAAVWFPALKVLAEQNDWRLDTYFKNACTYNSASRHATYQVRQTTCDAWNAKLTDRLAQSDPYEYIVTSSRAQNSDFTNLETGENGFRIGVAGYKEVWGPMIERGSTVLVLKDYPRSEKRVMECAIEDPEDDCALPHNQATVPVDKQVITVAADEMAGAEVIDMDRWFCIDDRCPAVIGNVHVYRDPGHFTESYSISLSRALAHELEHQTSFAPPID